MGVLRKIQYNCRHATFLIEKKQHTSLTMRERFELAIHLAGCSVCRLFQRQSHLINRMMRILFHSEKGQDKKLSDEFKKELQQTIDDRSK